MWSTTTRKRDIIQEEIDLKERLEREEYLNEFNYKIHGKGTTLDAYHKKKMDTYFNETLKKAPTRPAYFKLGIANPTEMYNDPKYWLAKDLKPLDEQGKRQRRIKYLKKKQADNVEGLELKLRKLKQIQSDAAYDAREYYDEQLEPMWEGVLKPVSKALKKRIAFKTNEYLQEMWRLYTKRKKRFMKMLRGGKEEHELDDEVVKLKVNTIKKEAHKEMMIRRLSDKRWQEELDSAEKARRTAFKNAMFLENAYREGLSQVWEAYESIVAAVMENVGEIFVEPKEAFLYQTPFITEESERNSMQFPLKRYVPQKEELAEEEEEDDTLEAALDVETSATAGEGHEMPLTNATESNGLISSAVLTRGQSTAPSGAEVKDDGKSEMSESNDGKSEFEQARVSHPVYTQEERQENDLMQAEDNCLDDMAAVIDFSYEIVHGPTDAAEEIIEDCVIAAVDIVESHKFAGDEAIRDAMNECIDAAIYYGECHAAEKRRIADLKDNILIDRLGHDTGFDKVWLVIDCLCGEVVRLTKLEEAKRGKEFFGPNSALIDIGESDEDALRRIQAEAGMSAAEEEISEELKQEQEMAERIAELERLEEEEAARQALEPNAQEIEREQHAHFRRLKRRRIKEGYDPELVDCLNKMIIGVDLAQEFEEPPFEVYEQVEDDYDLDAGKAETDSNVSEHDEAVKEAGEDSEGEDINDSPDDSAAAVEATTSPAIAVKAEENGEEEKPKDLIGCEISFMVRVSDQDRMGEGLEDLEAEDVAVLLQNQVMDMDSQLKKGYIGSRVLDVQYKLPFQKRTFDTWESYWVHSCHPCFFYRGTAKRRTTKTQGRKDGRLASGLLMHNPTSEFSQRSKDTFLMLSKKYGKKRPTAAKPKPGQELDPAAQRRLKEMEEKAKKKAEANKGVVDLNVDEFAEDEKKLQIVRPNMNNLNKKEVERLRRISVAFEEHYQMEMLKGLEQPGNRLKFEQYSALKDRDASARIYRNAKAKLQMEQRKLGADQSEYPFLIQQRFQTRSSSNGLSRSRTTTQKQ